MSQEETVLLLGVVICIGRFMWTLGGGAGGVLDLLCWDDAELRRALRMARNRAFIERCEKLTGKKFETYAEAADAWDAAGYFLPWRRWRGGKL